MRIGHGSAELPVVPGEPLGGYADRSDGVVDVLDPLEVHVVTFADGSHRFALVTADLVCVNTDVVASVRTALGRRLPVDSCWVAATHTHASPEAGCVPGGGPTPPAVADRLVECAVEAAEAAIAAEVHGRLRPARALIPGLAGRRSNSVDSAVDVPVDALLCTVRGGVDGVLAVCPVHPTILSADNNRVSADLNGGIRRALTGTGRWAVVATGAAGDISTRHTRRSREVDEIGRLGRLTADQVDKTLPAPPDEPVTEAITSPVSQVVRLEPKRAAEVERLLAEPLSMHAVDERSQWVLRQGRQIAADLASRQRVEPYEIDVQAIGLGAVTLVAVPAELYLELGEQIRSRAGLDGHDVVVLGYTNGYLGYLPTQHAPTGYETYVSPVTGGSGETVVEAAVDAVSRLRRPRSADA
jgi:hypothetical protein